MNVSVSCNVLSRWAQLVSVFSRTDSDIQISKSGLQLKLKLHQLWRTAMWLSHDCSWILTAACFSGDNVSIWTGVRSSSLGDNFWISDCSVIQFPLCDQTRPWFRFSTRTSSVAGLAFFLVASTTATLTSYLFFAVIISALVICSVNWDYVECW